MKGPLRLSRRLTLELVSAVLLPGLAVAASIPIDGFIGRHRIEAVSNVRITGGGTIVRADLARPPGPGPYPAVLMIHGKWGLNPDIAGKATRRGYDAPRHARKGKDIAGRGQSGQRIRPTD